MARRSPPKLPAGDRMWLSARRKAVFPDRETHGSAFGTSFGDRSSPVRRCLWRNARKHSCKGLSSGSVPRAHSAISPLSSVGVFRLDGACLRARGAFSSKSPRPWRRVRSRRRWLYLKALPLPERRSSYPVHRIWLQWFLTGSFSSMEAAWSGRGHRRHWQTRLNSFRRFRSPVSLKPKSSLKRR